MELELKHIIKIHDATSYVQQMKSRFLHQSTKLLKSVLTVIDDLENLHIFRRAKLGVSKLVMVMSALVVSGP